jgi:hypothetical protein
VGEWVTKLGVIKTPQNEAAYKGVGLLRHKKKVKVKISP